MNKHLAMGSRVCHEEYDLHVAAGQGLHCFWPLSQRLVMSAKDITCHLKDYRRLRSEWFKPASQHCAFTSQHARAGLD